MQKAPQAKRITGERTGGARWITSSRNQNLIKARTASSAFFSTLPLIHSLARVLSRVAQVHVYARGWITARRSKGSDFCHPFEPNTCVDVCTFERFQYASLKIESQFFCFVGIYIRGYRAVEKWMAPVSGNFLCDWFFCEVPGYMLHFVEWSCYW